MKSLQAIQKTCKIFQTLTKIVMILCFVGSGLLLLGLICGIVISSAGAVVSGGVETLYKLTASASFYEMIGTLLAEFVLTLTDALLFFHAWKYFSAEQADGTPFSHRGADLMKRLGILLIVLPAVATILVGVLHGIFDMLQIEAADVGNGTSVMMGIMLILISVILRYGAEFEEREDKYECIAMITGMPIEEVIRDMRTSGPTSIGQLIEILDRYGVKHAERNTRISKKNL